MHEHDFGTLMARSIAEKIQFLMPNRMQTGKLVYFSAPKSFYACVTSGRARLCPCICRNLACKSLRAPLYVFIQYTLDKNNNYAPLRRSPASVSFSKCVYYAKLFYGKWTKLSVGLLALTNFRVYQYVHFCLNGDESIDRGRESEKEKERY